MIEIWRSLINIDPNYQVSNLGNWKVLERDVMYSDGKIHHYDERMLNPVLTCCGYLQVTIHRKAYRAHRVIAETFIDMIEIPEKFKGLPFDELVINHKNQIKTDNRVDNLMICDAQFNNTWGDRVERCVKGNINHPKKSKPVEQYTKDMVLVAEYPSAKEAERQTGISNANIIQCCKGRLKTAGGYIWKYKEKGDLFN